MLYALICIDKPGSGEIRQAHREAHLDHLRAAGEAVRQAGPFLDGDGAMCGSLIILEAPDQTEVERWAAEDPYAKAGLFDSVSIRPWNRVIG